MSTNSPDKKLEQQLSKERQKLFEKLSNIFDPETANDYILPKTHEIRQQLSLEELRQLNYHEQDDYFQRLRSMVHYKTTTQSLPRADLEASYHSFVRDQLIQQSPRYELEQFVRNSADIDTAKRYADMANDVLINPQQALLVFRSAKLNEQKANLLKSNIASKSRQELNDDPSIQKYFTEKLHNTSKSLIDDEDEYFNNESNSIRCRSMHLRHNERKYHIEFLKKSLPEKSSSPRRLQLSDRRIQSKNIESLFETETSTTNGPSTDANTSNIHREIFPPLSFSALKEYRPTILPKAKSLRKTSSSSSSTTTINIQRRAKPMHKTDFLWNQSIVSPTKHE